MTNTLTDRERRRLSQLAREYSQRGYKVQTTLPEYAKPHKIGRWIPDLIARKGDETIIVEVKTSVSLKRNKTKVAWLSKYAKTNEGVRFDLVLTNPRPQSSPTRRNQTLSEQLSAIEHSLLETMEEANKSGNESAIPLLAVVMLEGLLARAAFKRGLTPTGEDLSLQDRAQYLFNEEVISSSVLRLIREVAYERDAIVHRQPLGKKRDWNEIIRQVRVLSEEW